MVDLQTHESAEQALRQRRVQAYGAASPLQDAGLAGVADVSSDGDDEEASGR